MLDATASDGNAQRMRDHAIWLRDRAAETDNDLYRWLMQSLAEELEQQANADGRAGVGCATARDD